MATTETTHVHGMVPTIDHLRDKQKELWRCVIACQAANELYEAGLNNEGADSAFSTLANQLMERICNCLDEYDTMIWRFPAMTPPPLSEDHPQ